MLSGKTILLGVTGGIAAYKAAALASALVKLHASVEVVMTRNATQFITPLTFEQVSCSKVRGVMNWVAFRVITTSTEAWSFTSAEASAAAL